MLTALAAADPAGAQRLHGSLPPAAQASWQAVLQHGLARKNAPAPAPGQAAGAGGGGGARHHGPSVSAASLRFG